jgi:hypothetical protein
MDESNSLTLEEHINVGQSLKRCSHRIEQVRAGIRHSYPKSSKKELRQLQTAFDNIRSVQTSMHGRLLAEFPEKSDEELLPIYLGRL